MTDNERMGRLLAAHELNHTAMQLHRQMVNLLGPKSKVDPEVKLATITQLIVQHARLLAEAQQLKASP